MDWLNKFLKDEVLTDLISAIKFVTPIIVLLFYWGFLENIDIGGLKLSMISIVAIIFMWGIDGIRLDWRKRGYQKAFDESEELQNLAKQISEIEFDESDDLIGEDYARNKTLSAQEKSDKLKTSKEITKLKRKKYELLKKGKQAEHIENSIQYLQQNPIRTKPVKPFIYYDIITIDGTVKQDSVKDGSLLKDDPITYGRVRANVVGLVRYVALGGATAGLVWTQDPIVASVIIGGYILSAVSTAIVQFYLSIKYTMTKHRQHLHDKYNIKKECRTYCDKHKTTEEGVL